MSFWHSAPRFVSPWQPVQVADTVPIL